MKKFLSSISFGLLVFALLCCSSCTDDECIEEADLVIPNFISGQQVFMKSEFNYTIINENGYFMHYPYGTNLYVYNGSINEFYSVTRTNPYTGLPVTFYWNALSPPPWFFPYNANVPGGYPLQNFETVNIYKFVYNAALPDVDCLFKSAGESKTVLEANIIKIVNGEITETEVEEHTAPTEEIGPLQYKLVRFPIVLKPGGVYESFTFKANADNSVPERDLENNEFITRPENFEVEE